MPLPMAAMLAPAMTPRGAPSCWTRWSSTQTFTTARRGSCSTGSRMRPVAAATKVGKTPATMGMTMATGRRTTLARGKPAMIRTTKGRAMATMMITM
uniref:Uncharacterized protein n=1 Tax=Arundo donax TaxID=35708 RepID=A0A0A9HID5_ARUDO